MKYISTLFLIFYITNCKAQSHELFLSVYKFDGYFNTTSNKKNIVLSSFQYGLGYSYITAKNIQYSISYGRSNIHYSVNSITPYTTYIGTIAYNHYTTWQKGCISVAKRNTYKKLLFISGIVSELEMENNKYSQSNFKTLDINTQALKTEYVQKNIAPYNIGIALYITQGLYYAIQKNMHIGIDVKAGFLLQKTKGKESSIAQNTYPITDTAIEYSQYNNTYNYSIPILTNISIRYLLPQKHKKKL